MRSQCRSVVEINDGDANVEYQCEHPEGHAGAHMYIVTWEGCSHCESGKYGHAKHVGGGPRHPGVDDQGERIVERL